MEKHQKIGLVTSQSVHKATQKNWDQWLKIMDGEGALNLTHQQMVALLKKKYKLNIWWQQEVAKGYQIAKGLRIAGQNLKGQYTLTLTKTISYPATAFWKFLTSPEGIQWWLKPMSEVKMKVGQQFEVEGGIFGEIRTMKAGQRLRLSWINEDWPKKSVVQILILPRPKNKCMLVINQEGLTSARIKLEMRAYWQGILAEIVQNPKISI